MFTDDVPLINPLGKNKMSTLLGSNYNVRMQIYTWLLRICIYIKHLCKLPHTYIRIIFTNCVLHLRLHVICIVLLISV